VTAGSGTVRFRLFYCALFSVSASSVLAARIFSFHSPAVISSLPACAELRLEKAAVGLVLVHLLQPALFQARNAPRADRTG
jgi:hypothetical protein